MWDNGVSAKEKNNKQQVHAVRFFTAFVVILRPTAGFVRYGASWMRVINVFERGPALDDGVQLSRLQRHRVALHFHFYYSMITRDAEREKREEKRKKSVFIYV